VYASIVFGILCHADILPVGGFLQRRWTQSYRNASFFPYGVLGGRLFQTTIEWLEPILIILQFPAYGDLLSLTLRRKTFKTVLVSIAVLHLTATVAGLVLEHFH
jgi:hypothetical protein